MFIEVAAGLETLALIHFAGNAFLRTYQLLVSPSIVSYLIREQFYGFNPQKKNIKSGFKSRLILSCYMWSLKEWNLDKLINRIVFRPLKNLGHRLDFLSYKSVLYYFIPSYILGLSLLVAEIKIPENIRIYLPTIFGFIALLMVLKAFSERNSARLSWILLILNHFWMVLAIAENELFAWPQVAIYLSGVVFFGVSGLLIIDWLKRLTGQHGLHHYKGYVAKYPIVAFLFLVSALGLMGFPLSPTFLGEDLLFSHIHEDQILLASIAALTFVMEGIVTIRILARLFMGSKIDQEISALSSEELAIKKKQIFNSNDLATKAIK
jgi:NADH:ubiquinone oxidoreductase subunit 5 (subunit L)/multisubunit Na+/H+ antiporter MnhA subunit